MYQAGRRLFGTWRAAVERAGLNYVESTGVHHWDDDEVVDTIRKLAARGVPLFASYIQQNHASLFWAAIKRFGGSWRKVLEAAAFDPNDHRAPRGIWDRAKVENWVRERSAAPQSILARDVPPDLLQFVQRTLGVPWTDFVESLGIAYPGIKKRRDWSRKTLLAEIQQWHRTGHRLNYRAVKTEYQAMIHQARKFFGSWDRARAAAQV
jgi:hypothetical protein